MPVLITLLLPRFIGVEQYSYYQLYIFYASYVGFLGLGWHEGVYLELGGKYYSSIDKQLYKSQWIYYSLLELLFSIIICVYAFSLVNQVEKKIVLLAFGVS